MVPFYMGLELLDPSKYTEFILLASAKLAPIAQSPPKYHGSDSLTPELPANPHMKLAQLYSQLGIYLAYWTGKHELSLSDNPAQRTHCPLPTVLSSHISSSHLTGPA